VKKYLQVPLCVEENVFGQMFCHIIAELDVLLLKSELEDHEELVEKVMHLFSGLNWLEP